MALREYRDPASGRHYVVDPDTRRTWWVAAPPPAAWYQDPADVQRLRYWDGARWSEHCAPRSTSVAVQQTTPPAASVSEPPSLAQLVQKLRLEAPRYPLEEQIEVAGETYHIRGIKGVFKDHGMPITRDGVTLDDLECIVVPERWNEHDPNAVAVMVGEHQVGYLPAVSARQYSPPLLRLASSGVLATGEAKIWAKTDSGVARARVTVLLPEPHVLSSRGRS